MGPPLSNSKSDAESADCVFICRVCDRFQDCGEISVSVQVFKKTEFTVEEERQFILSYVDREMDKGNYLESLVNYNMLLQKIKELDQDAVSKRTAKQFEIAQKIAENNNALSPDDLELLIDQIMQIDVVEMEVIDQSEFVDILWSISERFLSFMQDEVDHVSQVSISRIVEKANQIAGGLRSEQYSDIIDRTRDTIMDMVVMRTRRLLFGQMFEIKTEDMTITVKKDTLNGVFHSRSTAGPAIIQFGSELEQQVLYSIDHVLYTIDKILYLIANVLNMIDSLDSLFNKPGPPFHRKVLYIIDQVLCMIDKDLYLIDKSSFSIYFYQKEA
ncbi:uncharacterized protein LOC144434208 [Glandiceps talaboti]